MNRRRLTSALLLALLLMCAQPACAQLEAYRFDAARVPAGRVFHYLKSQRDGSHEARISVYMASVDHIEALKWDQGGDEATLIIGVMDWSRFSINHFQGWHLARGATPQARVTLDVVDDRLSMSLMSEPLRIAHWPWHSYDFDFTSLNLTLPHLVAPQGTLVFWRTDFVYADPPRVAELGELTLRFEKRERRQGRSVRRYSLGGAGLQDATGTWWSDAREGWLVEFELPIGDEPGYRDVRMTLDSTRKISAAEWESFKRGAIGER